MRFSTVAAFAAIAAAMPGWMGHSLSHEDCRSADPSVEARLALLQQNIRMFFPVRSGMAESELDQLIQLHRQRSGSDELPGFAKEMVFLFVFDAKCDGGRFVTINCHLGWSTIEVRDEKVRRVWFQHGTMETTFGQPFLISGPAGDIESIFPCAAGPDPELRQILEDALRTGS